MASKMFDVKRVIAMLQIVSDQERVNRFHNAPSGEIVGYQNSLMVLLGRCVTNLPLMVGLKSLWESIMAEQV